jgi:hypothetical protein
MLLEKAGQYWFALDAEARKNIENVLFDLLFYADTSRAASLSLASVAAVDSPY